VARPACAACRFWPARGLGQGRAQGIQGLAQVAASGLLPLLSNCAHGTPSPTLSPTDPVPRGLLTLCPGPALAHRAYIQPIYSLYTAYTKPIHSPSASPLFINAVLKMKRAGKHVTAQAMQARKGPGFPPVSSSPPVLNFQQGQVITWPSGPCGQWCMRQWCMRPVVHAGGTRSCRLRGQQSCVQPGSARRPVSPYLCLPVLGCLSLAYVELWPCAGTQVIGLVYDEEAATLEYWLDGKFQGQVFSNLPLGCFPSCQDSADAVLCCVVLCCALPVDCKRASRAGAASSELWLTRACYAAGEMRFAVSNGWEGACAFATVGYCMY